MEPKAIYRVLMLAITMLALIKSKSVSCTTSATLPFPLTLPGCKNTCGDIEVPYPFGIGNSSIPGQGPCFSQFQSYFNLTCRNNSELHWGNYTPRNSTSVVVSQIDILHGQLQIDCRVAKDCGNGTYLLPRLGFEYPSFFISSEQNKFITVGCDSYGYLYNYVAGEKYSTGCLSRCYGNRKGIDNGTCSGVGCCQVDIPASMRNISISPAEFANSTEGCTEGCTYSFVVKKGSYTFSTTHLDNFPYQKLPLILEWSVGNKKCKASKSEADFACRNNTDCIDVKDLDTGYRCKCRKGYQGNPYHPDGCIDINECLLEDDNTCLSNQYCRNTNGSFECFCPEGQIGDGTELRGCHKPNLVTKIAIGSSVSFIILFAGASSLYLIYQRRKLIKLKETFFQQNGGFILLQKISTREDSSGCAQLFKEDQLKKATNNYDESLIIGRGGFGIVFKGFLEDNKIVAIKKSKTIDSSQVDQFINEVVVLSQINHRNVVKLLGCCLETEIPLLVYEFVSNGTLFDLIHTKEKAINMTWKTRLRIATETAGALSYLHSAASTPIIHRDVKSANILLDDTYTAKVSDFGASRLVPLDQTEIATMVQGTLGYLDPEYMQSQQLTEKSDVYSFGVVLAELLTGEKSISFNRPEDKRSLAMHFLSSLKENCIFEVLQVGILNEENKEEINEVVILAAKCLRLKGEERPSMKEIAMELEGIRLMEKHPWIDSNINLEESHCLLPEASSNIYGTSDSSNRSEYDSLRVHASIALDDGR